MNKIKEIRREELEDFTKKSIAIVDEEREILGDLRTYFSTFLSKESSISSKRFIKAV
jgi:hypothetical protein